MGEMNLVERLRHALATEPMSRADDVAKLLDAIETLMAGLDDAIDTIHGEYCGGGTHHPVCQAPRNALARAEERLK